MFRDARGIQNGSSVETDLCIIGGGAAGITLALGAKEAGFSTLVVEAGGFDFDDETQAVYSGTVVSDVLRRLTFGPHGFAKSVARPITGAVTPSSSTPISSGRARVSPADSGRLAATSCVPTTYAPRRSSRKGRASGNNGGLRLRPASCPWSAMRDRRWRKTDWVPRTVRNWRRRDCRFSSTAA